MLFYDFEYTTVSFAVQDNDHFCLIYILLNIAFTIVFSVFVNVQDFSCNVHHDIQYFKVRFVLSNVYITCVYVDEIVLNVVWDGLSENTLVTSSYHL